MNVTRNSLKQSMETIEVSLKSMINAKHMFYKAVSFGSFLFLPKRQGNVIFPHTHTHKGENYQKIAPM